MAIVGNTGTGKKRIFLVEDEALIAMELQDRLEHLGYRVAGTAARGEQALEAIPRLQPDLVMMDINILGQMNGIEVAEALQQVCDVPVIFLSAYSSAEMIERASRVRSYGYLVKPFAERELYTAIETALARYEVDRGIHELNLKLEQRVQERSEELRQAQSRAQAALKARAGFLAGMSHELRTPLNAIMGFADILEMESQTMPPAVREHVARIRHAGRELLAIVESMLGMNEVLADSPIQAENLSLKTLVESVLELLGEVSQRAGIRLEMAPDQADVRVRADRRWLEQALAGLLVQMLHMQTRGSSLRLQLNQTTSGVGEICLLAPQREDLKPALMRAAGVGGELAAVRRLLARMDGLIHFDPEVDAGMVCRLRLPAETARL